MSTNQSFFAYRRDVAFELRRQAIAGAEGISPDEALQEMEDFIRGTAEHFGRAANYDLSHVSQLTVDVFWWLLCLHLQRDAPASFGKYTYTLKAEALTDDDWRAHDDAGTKAARDVIALERLKASLIDICRQMSRLPARRRRQWERLRKRFVATADELVARLFEWRIPDPDAFLDDWCHAHFGDEDCKAVAARQPPELYAIVGTGCALNAFRTRLAAEMEAPVEPDEMRH